MQQTYSDASARQAAFAKGFSDHMQATLGQNATNTSNFLQNVVGAPSSQIAQVQGQVAPAAAGDTLYGVKGFIPASTLNEEGAAYTANANQLPAIANSQGLQQIGRVQQAQNVTDQGFANELAKIAGSIPQIRHQLATDAFNQNYKTTEQAIAKQKLINSENSTKFNQGATIARLNLEAKKFAQQQFQQNRMYGIALANLGIRNKELQMKVAANAYTQAHGGFSAKQVAAFGTKMDALLASAGTLTHAIDTPNGRVMPGSVAYDKNGKVVKLRPDGSVPPGVKVAKWDNTSTYTNFIKGALKKGIPVQLAIARANTIWPETERGNLGSLMNLPAIAAQSAQQQQDYNQTTGRTPAAVSSPQVRKLQSYAFSQMGRYGWSGQDAAALQQLWNGESGWDPSKVNPSSGAAGIPQALGHRLPADYAKNPQSQIKWGLNYIKQRYGSPSRAWAFWQATVGKDPSLAPPDLQQTAQYWVAHGYAGY